MLFIRGLVCVRVLLGRQLWDITLVDLLFASKHCWRSCYLLFGAFQPIRFPVSGKDRQGVFSPLFCNKAGGSHSPEDVLEPERTVPQQ